MTRLEQFYHEAKGNRWFCYFTVICRVVYDPKHAAFLIKWPDGYINQYFMTGTNYEVADSQIK